MSGAGINIHLLLFKITKFFQYYLRELLQYAPKNYCYVHKHCTLIVLHNDAVPERYYSTYQEQTNPERYLNSFNGVYMNLTSFPGLFLFPFLPSVCVHNNTREPEPKTGILIFCRSSDSVYYCEHGTAG